MLSYETRLHGQAVKTPPFHGGNRGSNPLGVIDKKKIYEKGYKSLLNISLKSLNYMPTWLNWQSS